MKYLFWNVNKRKDINSFIVKLVEEYQPNIFALAEYDDDLMNKLMIQLKSTRYHVVKRVGCRIWIFTNIDLRYISHGPDDRHFTLKIFPYNEREKQVIAFTHMPSKYPQDDEGRRRIVAEELNRTAQEFADAKGIKNIVYIGDFNMNPYENPMMEISGLHANPSRNIVARKTREVYKRQYKFLYNPMWNFLGDKTLPEGTYYYESPKVTSEYWNIFDQFLVSAELAVDVKLSKIKIITSVGGCNLYKGNYEPDISDHFPLYFEIGGN